MTARPSVTDSGDGPFAIAPERDEDRLGRAVDHPETAGGLFEPKCLTKGLDAKCVRAASRVDAVEVATKRRRRHKVERGGLIQHRQRQVAVQAQDVRGLRRRMEDLEMPHRQTAFAVATSCGLRQRLQTGHGPVHDREVDVDTSFDYLGRDHPTFGFPGQPSSDL